MSCEIGRCSPCQLWQVRTWFRACECWCCDSYSLPEALDPSLKEIICDTLLVCDSRGDVGCVPLTCLTAWLGPTFLILEKHILLLLCSGCGGAEDFPECYLISECMLFVAKSIPIFVFFFFFPFPSQLKLGCVEFGWLLWFLSVPFVSQQKHSILQCCEEPDVISSQPLQLSWRNSANNSRLLLPLSVQT